MKKQTGFTLIELVVVIVILGILAATAAPKFIDLTGDARGSVVEAVRGSLNSAADLAHSKALIAGETGSADVDISVAGETITFNYGWPKEDQIEKLLTYDDDIEEVSGSEGTFTHASATTQSTCVAVYSMTDVNSTTDRPSITSDVDGC